MRRRIWRLAIAVAILLAMAQLLRPARKNPPEAAAAGIDSRLKMAPGVAEILDRSCADCHSNRTRWPWYSRIAPASWIVAGDVNRGRRHMNFSAWAEYRARKAARLLDRMCAYTRDGRMPLASYVWLHADARLSPEEIERICDWSIAAREVLLKEAIRMGEPPPGARGGADPATER